MPDLQNIIDDEDEILRRGAGGALSSVSPAQLAANAAFTAAFGMAGIAPAVTMLDGNWWAAPATRSTGAQNANALTLHQVYIPRETRLGGIAAEVTTGTASAVVRLGIYADDEGLPSSLVVDAGTIDGNSATVQSLTIGVTLPKGLYWLGAAVQVAGPVTMRTIGSVITGAGSNTVGSVLAASPTPRNGIQALGVNGALPADISALTFTAQGAVPAVAVRRVDPT